jgi:hypothetical protein
MNRYENTIFRFQLQADHPKNEMISYYHRVSHVPNFFGSIYRDMAFCCSSFKDGPPELTKGSSPDRWKVLVLARSLCQREGALVCCAGGALRVPRRTHSLYSMLRSTAQPPLPPST